MEILKKKEVWISALTILVMLTVFNWLFKEGWTMIKGGITFEESIKEFEFKAIWVAISFAVAYFNIRRAKK
jgi:uncharacterized membrane protein YphA (DoxX/SURF4 family)